MGNCANWKLPISDAILMSMNESRILINLLCIDTYSSASTPFIYTEFKVCQS